MSVHQKFGIFVILAVTFATQGCKQRTKGNLLSQLNEDRRGWVVAAYKVMTRSYGSHQDLNSVLKDSMNLSDDNSFKRSVLAAIKRHKPSEFHETVFDFLMFYTGIQRESYFRNGRGALADSAGTFWLQSFPAQMHALMNFTSRGRMDVLFNYRQPFFFFEKYPAAHFNVDEIFENSGEINKESLAKAISSAYANEYSDASLKTFLGKLEQDLYRLRSSVSREEYCEQRKDLPVHFILTGNSGALFANYLNYCGIHTYLPQKPAFEVLAKQISKTQVETDLLKMIEFYADSKLTSFYSDHQLRLEDILVKEPAELGLTRGQAQFQDVQWGILTNNSTQHHYRRAAYMLSTYFCDEIQFITSTTSASKVSPTTQRSAMPSLNHPNLMHRHASDPACRSCHSKLDPLSGFFISQGSNPGLGPRSTDYEGLRAIDFFDVKTYTDKAYDKYVQDGWETSPGDLEIGVRLQSDGPLVFKGRTLDELFAFLKNEPKVYQCMAKRMSQYFFGEKQAISEEWLLEKAQRLQSRKLSASDFEAVFDDFLMSDTFAALEFRDEMECYDGMERGSANCAISGHLNKYCGSCHLGRGAEGGFDFREWLSSSSYSYTSESQNKVLNKRESFSILKTKLESSNPEVMMPPGGLIPPEIRKKLINWLEKNIHE